MDVTIFVKILQEIIIRIKKYDSFYSVSSLKSSIVYYLRLVYKAQKDHSYFFSNTYWERERERESNFR